MFQGKADPKLLEEYFALDSYLYYNGNCRNDGCLNMMKAAIFYSDVITTVSPTYAKEILTDQYGEGLQSILEMRKHDLYGILNGVDLDISEKGFVSIVGESGSGKSVACKTIMRILSSNGYIKDGQILFDGKDLTKISEKDMEKVRGKDIAMIFQDPMTSLNPTMTIGKQIMEPIIKHQGFSKEDARKRALELIELVGISDAEKRFKQYPHQFSGGMRQRIVIAISLACNPKVLIADEPTTALDVTIQAQILELIKDLQEKTGVAVIFITHDLGVVANMADRVAVMYAGKIIEYGTSDDIFYDPKHPYTWGLLGSMPTLDIGDNDLYNIPGTPPDLMDPPKGDAFALRSAYAMKIDHLAEPPMFKVSDTHYAATWLLHPLAPKIERPVNVGRKKVNINE